MEKVENKESSLIILFSFILSTMKCSQEATYGQIPFNKAPFSKKRKKFSQFFFRGNILKK
jgi:hypothetical protein